MSQLTRPTKQGGAVTYQGKVGAGYTTILASEMDADLDKIYSAWNTGVDGSNIQPGVITGGMLAPGAVGSRELADGGIQTVDIGNQQITTPLLADGAVTAGKLVGGGVMGGDLSGSYPNPSLSTIQSGLVVLGYGAHLQAFPGNFRYDMNAVGNVGADASKASWFLQFSTVDDSFGIFHAPPGSGTYANPLYLDTAGKLHVVLANGAVTQAQLGVNAIYGASSGVVPPPNFSLSTANVWTPYATLPAITTRGAHVMLSANCSLSVSGPTGAGGLCQQRWLRDGALVLAARTVLVATAPGTYVPLPSISGLDDQAPAGTHVYTYEIFVQPSVVVLGASTTDGLLQAYEVG